MIRYCVVKCCGNTECKSASMKMVVPAFDLEGAYITANILNSKAGIEPCEHCGRQLVYYPHSDDRE